MKLIINNIGIVKEANIDIEGITVVVGENGTGKSTIGKALFCVYDSLFELERKIKNERARTIERLLQFSVGDISRRAIRELGRKLVELPHDQVSGGNVVKAIKSSNVMRESDETELEQLVDKITDVLKISDKDIRDRIVQKSLEAEFADKILNVNDESKIGSISVHVKDEDILLDICDNKVDVTSNVVINKQAIYIDDPYIADEVGGMSFWPLQYANYGHRKRLVDKLTKKTEKITAVDEIIYGKKMDSVMQCMSSVCPGRLEVNSTGDIDYISNNLREPLKMVNLSTGLKSFAIIKTLLEKGEIEENGIIILDEPEVHLHPEWQMRYAEMIVLLQKMFNINFLISTHSPDFLTAVELYSKKNELTSNRYYYIKKVGGALYPDIQEVTGNIDIIYKSLSEPMVSMSREMDYEI